MPDFRTYFVKDGVRYDAKDYGYKAWPLSFGKRRSTKKTSRGLRKKHVKA